MPLSSWARASITTHHLHPDLPPAAAADHRVHILEKQVWACRVVEIRWSRRRPPRSVSRCVRRLRRAFKLLCDDCRFLFVCDGCHWCHEFQANHILKVCDRCDAFYCRGCERNGLMRGLQRSGLQHVVDADELCILRLRLVRGLGQGVRTL